MRTNWFAVTLLLLIVPAGGSETLQIDWQKARELHRRASRGEKLSEEDQRYYEEARRQRARQSRPQGERPRVGNKDWKPGAAAQGLVPLTELTGRHLGHDGGLYGGGNNEPPPDHQALAAKAAAQVQPLDRNGNPSPKGKIVLMSIGMSNTSQEFSRFVPLANAHAAKAGNVVIVNGAQGGQAAREWSTSDARPWAVAADRLVAASVSPDQVQVVWIKQANKSPSQGSEAEMQRLQDDMGMIVTLAKQKFAHLRLAFLGSRIYGGYAQSTLNPEPYAYESAFSMQGLILKQIQGLPALNADPAKGELKAPVLLWGPYLWAAGPTPRKNDGLVWLPEDLSGDGTHPSAAGADKVARMLLDFFLTNPNTKPWFVKQ